MTKGLRIALWVLSSLAVLWTILVLIGLFTMGGITPCPGCPRMIGGGMMGGRGGMMMGWMVFGTGLVWLLMLGLDALFVYLLVTAMRAGRPAQAS